MNDKAENNALLYLDAVQALLQEVSTRPGHEPVPWLADLYNSLDIAKSHSEAVEKMMSEIRKHPGIYQELMEKVWDLEAIDARESGKNTRGYQELPGTSIPLPPGTRMVCPKDPQHYQRFLRTIGQRMSCPLHNCELIPQVQKREK